MCDGVTDKRGSVITRLIIRIYTQCVRLLSPRVIK